MKYVNQLRDNVHYIVKSKNVVLIKTSDLPPIMYKDTDKEAVYVKYANDLQKEFLNKAVVVEFNGIALHTMLKIMYHIYKETHTIPSEISEVKVRYYFKNETV